MDKSETLQRLNAAISEGFVFTDTRVFDTDRRITLSKHMGGSVYTITDIADESLQKELDQWVYCCGVGVSVAKISVGGRAVYTVILNGEKNPVKALFGKDRDKFAVLSSMKIHRELIFLGSYSDHPTD